jgi:hypothetical protein
MGNTQFRKMVQKLVAFLDAIQFTSALKIACKPATKMIGHFHLQGI